MATYLSDALWDRADEGANYNCTENDVDEFISNRIDNGDFDDQPGVTPRSIQVADNNVDAWVEQFKLWLEQQQ